MILVRDASTTDSENLQGFVFCVFKIWEIPDGGLKQNLEDPVADLVAHQRRVGLIEWHPSAQNILLSGGMLV